MNKTYTDIELIEKIKKGDEKDKYNSIKEIDKRHSGIFCKMVNTYAPKDSCEKRNVLDDKLIIMYNSALEFDEKRKTKFSSFLALKTRWACQNLANKANKYKHENEKILNNFTYEEDSSCFLEEERLLYLVSKIISDNFDEKTKEIFRCRYFENNKKARTWTSIASKIGLCIQSCINRHDRALKKIKEEIKQYDSSK